MPAEDLVFRLIGDMLGANMPWAQGTVRIARHDDAYRERFWQSRGRTWRVERSDGLTFTDRVALGSTTVRPDGTVERGPSTGLTFTASVQLLKPSTALIWGRAGEDWRLTSQVAPADRQGLWRVVLQHVEDSQRLGFIVVEEGLGVLHQIHREGEGSLILEELESVNIDQLDEDTLLRSSPRRQG